MGKVWGGEESKKSKECGCNFRVEASEAGAATMGIQCQEKPDLTAILAQKKRKESSGVSRNHLSPRSARVMAHLGMRDLWIQGNSGILGLE